MEFTETRKYRGVVYRALERGSWSTWLESGGKVENQRFPTLHTAPSGSTFKYLTCNMNEQVVIDKEIYF